LKEVLHRYMEDARDSKCLRIMYWQTEGPYKKALFAFALTMGSTLSRLIWLRQQHYGMHSHSCMLVHSWLNIQ